MTTVPAGAPKVKIGDWLGDGWEVFASDIGMFILASVIYNVILIAASIVTAGIGTVVLYGPLTCGMYLMIFACMKGNTADVKHIFAGFNFFGSSSLAGLVFVLLSIVCAGIGSVMSMFCVIGSIVGIAANIFLVAAFLFTFQLIVQQGKNTGDAISLSLDKVRENLGQYLLFCLILWLIAIAGYCTVIGWLVTTPLTLGASAAAYRDIFGLEGSQEELQPNEV